MIENKCIKLHRKLAGYHAELARKSTIDDVSEYHLDLSERLAAEARLIADRVKIANEARRLADRLRHHSQQAHVVA